MNASFKAMRFIVSVGQSIYQVGDFFGYLLGIVQGIVTGIVLNLVYDLSNLVNKIAVCLMNDFAALCYVFGYLISSWASAGP